MLMKRVASKQTDGNFLCKTLRRNVYVFFLCSRRHQKKKICINAVTTTAIAVAIRISQSKYQLPLFKKSAN